MIMIINLNVNMYINMRSNIDKSRNININTKQVNYKNIVNYRRKYCFTYEYE